MNDTSSEQQQNYWIWFWGDYKLGSIIEEIRFDDFNKMKTFSAEHSAKYKEKFSFYYSNYITYKDKR